MGDGRQDEGAPMDPYDGLFQGYPGCHGEWRADVVASERCDDPSTMHACKVPCHSLLIDECFSAVGKCTSGQVACETACGGEWVSNMPVPPPPAPMPPAPTPRPSPSPCPGGSLDACLDSCP